MKPEHVGQDLSEFLDELGIREDVEAQVVKAILLTAFATRCASSV